MIMIRPSCLPQSSRSSISRCNSEFAPPGPFGCGRLYQSSTKQVLGASHTVRWEFRPRTKIFSPPAPKTPPQTPSRNLGHPPPPSWKTPPPLLGLSRRNRPPFFLAPRTPPFTSPEVRGEEKIKKDRNVHQVLLGIIVQGPFSGQKKPLLSHFKSPYATPFETCADTIIKG